MNGRLTTLCAITCSALLVSILQSQSRPIPKTADNSSHRYIFKTEHLTDGRRPLSGISGVARSRDGFVWIAGTQELMRYDGYDLALYRIPWHEKDAKLANWNWAIHADRSDMIWTGTNGGGLKRFNPRTEQFTRYLADSADRHKLSRPVITCLAESHDETIWIGTPRGANSLDRERKHFSRFADDTSETSTSCSHAVTCILEDRYGTLWIGTTAGLSRFDTTLHRFVRCGNSRSASFRLPNDTVRALCSDRRGLIWVGLQSGIAVIDPTSGSTPPNLSDLRWPHDFSKRLITSLGTDRFGNIWIGTYGAGLFMFDPSDRGFTQFRHDPHDASTIRDDVIERIFADGTDVSDSSVPLERAESPAVIWVTCAGGAAERVVITRNAFENLATARLGLFEDRPIQIYTLSPSFDKDIWAGSWSSPFPGLLNIDLKKQRFTRFTADSTKSRSLGNNMVKQVFEDRDHNLWIVAAGKLQRFVRSTRDFKTIPLPGLAGCIGESRDGSLWLALLDKQIYAYVAKLDPRSEQVASCARPKETLVPPKDGGLYSIYEDTQGIVWVGTFSGGLCSFDTRTNTYRRFLSSPEDSAGLRNNNVRAIVEDRDGRLWIGSDGGLHTFNRRTQRVEFVPHPAYASTSLFSFFIRDMAYDRRGALWIASDHYLTRFEILTRTFRDFGPDEGLDIGRLAAIHYDSADHKVFVGGVAGIATFYPDRLVENRHIPPVVFTSYKIHEQPAHLPAPLIYTDKIEIPYRDNFFSFTFAVLDFVNPARNLYAYKLEGFDREWVFTGERRYASFTNLEPGSYLLRVKGSNSDGVWNEAGSSMRIIVTPPWYRSTPAYIAYFILLAAALYLFERLYRRRLTLRHEMQMKDFEARKLLEIGQIKSRFFTNISHEFRTPLTLILGPIERVKSSLDEPALRDDMDVMRRSGQRLLQLINRLLDLSKVDAGQMPLCARKTDLVPYLRTYVSSFFSYAERRGVELKYEASLDSIDTYVDREKLEEIVSNLISNAIKFTPRGGEVVLSLSTASKSTPDSPAVQIAVRDAGIGIPPDKLEKIFDRFFQVGNKHTGGTGIGLALAKELVELQGGTISASSAINEGSVFTIVLPIGKEHLRPDQIIEETSDDVIEPVVAQTPDASTLEIASTPDFVRDSGRQIQQPSILLIEDNADVRQFVKSILENDYVIEEANDGESGLTAAMESVPDLVVSDIMMPGMDGVEVCRKLKTDDRTSHIPVILLTARASSESKMEGLETGADDYVVKPFDAEELRARIRNLIHTRMVLREKYRQAFVLRSDHHHASSVEEHFLKKAIAAVEKHISEPGYETSTLAFELCMSRMSLNRKLQALTGHSTHDFIRTLRLHKSAHLLNQHSYNVSEVAYEVGFSSVSQFTKAFREQFGQLPSEYASNDLRRAID